MAEATEDSLGTYTCVPYNALGTMGMSPPATLVLKVGLPGVFSFPSMLWTNVATPVLFPQDPPYFNVRPGGEYRQEAGRELVIPCAASGDPDIPTITWRKVRQLIAMVLHVEISAHRESLSLLCPLKVGKPSKSKHNVLPSGSLQFLSLSKEDHGEWECVATNVVTSITASTRILVIGINTMLCTFVPDAVIL